MISAFPTAVVSSTRFCPATTPSVADPCEAAPFLPSRKARTVALLASSHVLGDSSWLLHNAFSSWFRDYRYALIHAGCRIIVLQKVFNELVFHLYGNNAELSQKAHEAIETILSNSQIFVRKPSSTLPHADPVLLKAALNAHRLHRVILLSNDRQLAVDLFNLLHGPEASVCHHQVLFFNSFGVLTSGYASACAVAPGCTYPACPELGHPEAFTQADEPAAELYLAPREDSGLYLERKLLPFSRMYMTAAALAEVLEPENDASAFMGHVAEQAHRPLIHLAAEGLAQHPGLREKLEASTYCHLFRILPEQPCHGDNEELALLSDLGLNVNVRYDTKVRKLVLITAEHEISTYRSINARLPKCYRSKSEAGSTKRSHDLPLWGSAVSADGCILRTVAAPRTASVAEAAPAEGEPDVETTLTA